MKKINIMVFNSHEYICWLKPSAEFLDSTKLPVPHICIENILFRTLQKGEGWWGSNVTSNVTNYF